jgi:uncharacterized protein (TIGR00375 family)
VFYADLHIHGPFSRGTSENLSIAKLEEYARIKGVGLMGAGDFTHPTWLETLKKELTPRDGALYTKSGFPFLLTSEISIIYSHEGKTRKVHHVVLAPDFAAVDSIRERLLKRGRLDYDGRPTFGMSCAEIVELVHDADDRCECIPAHAWTPWFSVFGSNSGFDSLKDAYQDAIKHIHAYETGLSSDPPMNWRVSQLDGFTLLSFSDSHSFWPWRIGRELTAFEGAPSYDNVLSAIRKNTVAGTVEVEPAYGKYHFDGHRDCGVSMSPDEARKHGNTCPVCHKPLTIGVLHRVEELADRPVGFQPKNAKPFHSLIPLSEIIAAVTGKGIATKAVWDEYNSLVRSSSELSVLLHMPRPELLSRSNERIADAIIQVRDGSVHVKPGYDGVYGEPELGASQKTLAGW